MLHVEAIGYGMSAFNSSVLFLKVATYSLFRRLGMRILTVHCVMIRTECYG